jgi:hypothetical protein
MMKSKSRVFPVWYTHIIDNVHVLCCSYRQVDGEVPAYEYDHDDEPAAGYGVVVGDQHETPIHSNKRLVMVNSDRDLLPRGCLFLDGKGSADMYATHPVNQVPSVAATTTTTASTNYDGYSINSLLRDESSGAEPSSVAARQPPQSQQQQQQRTTQESRRHPRRRVTGWMTYYAEDNLRMKRRWSGSNSHQTPELKAIRQVQSESLEDLPYLNMTEGYRC